MENTNQPIHWRAIYSSGQVQEQLDNSQEILYDNIDKQGLKQFHLLGGFVDVGIDLEDGSILLNNEKVDIGGFSNLSSNYRLIYYIRANGILGTNREPSKIYYLGMQTTFGNNNAKLVIELSQNRVSILQYRKFKVLNNGV